MNYFDLHCDTITECYNTAQNLAQNKLQLNLKDGKALEKWVQTYAIWLDDAKTDEQAYEYFNQVHDYLMGQIENESTLAFATTFDQIKEGLNQNKRVVLLSIENSLPVGKHLERVQDFYNKGVRMMTLTWNGRNTVGDGCMLEDAGGLTPFGKEVIKEMVRLGMLIDVSHLSEKGFWDVVNTVDVPFIATHSDSKVVCNHLRNLTDDQFKIFIERKAIVGVNFYPLFINNTLTASIDDLLPHIDHFLELGGENVIAVGSDFDGARMPKKMRGIIDIHYFYQLLTQRYGKAIADKITFENAMHFMKNNLN